MNDTSPVTTSTSYISESPTSAHPPIPPGTATLIWLAMAFAALIFGLMLLVHMAGRKKPEAVKPAVEPEAEPDQEWAHYPQPGDRAALSSRPELSSHST